MIIKIYQVDAFAKKVFSGNPAAVCPLESWLPDEILQKIAMENNLAETAFYVSVERGFEIRWFTPTVEVDLCGHATLAAGFVLFKYYSYKEDVIRFHSQRSGPLTVTREMDMLTLNFPTDVIESVEVVPELVGCFELEPALAFKGKSDYMLVFENQKQIMNLKPSFPDILKLQARGVIATAVGDEVDFVSRFFAPQSGINEDPVTGSAHTTLTPYWASRLNKKEMNALQLSERRGLLLCRYLGDRVEISGHAKEYLVGDIFLE